LLPAGPFKAYLFDCDGTLADSMPIHYRAWTEALSPWKCSFPIPLFYQYAGMSAPRIIELLATSQGLRLPITQINELREATYQRLLPEVTAVPQVLEVVRAWQGRIAYAVVSGSPRQSVIKTLTALGIEHDFEVIIGAEDSARGKPHPDPFLRAAEQLKVAPAECLVFEDAELGIQAAQAAGMQWVRVPATPII